LIDKNNRVGHLDALVAKAYFQSMLDHTGYPLCNQMIEKIAAIEKGQIGANPRMQQFILDNKEYLETVKGFTSKEYDKVNTGTTLEEVVFERNFLRKFGS
ncbi:MAG TPA: hypothetical protein VGE66_13950, partial [Chitinophagaceae bacterium]